MFVIIKLRKEDQGEEAIQFFKKGFSVALMIDQKSKRELVNFFSEKALRLHFPHN